MITDIYYLGEVLKRKYKILRISYTIFMIGLVLTVIAFGISIAYFREGVAVAEQVGL